MYFFLSGHGYERGGDGDRSAKCPTGVMMKITFSSERVHVLSDVLLLT